MQAPCLAPSPIPHRCLGLAATLALCISALPAQTVPPALESPAARPPVTGSNGEKLIGMPRFHDPAPYDIDEHTGYHAIFDGKTFTGWDADPTIWRVDSEAGLMIGETRRQAQGQQLHRLQSREDQRLRP